MIESDFAVSIMNSLRTCLGAAAWRPSDGFTLGLPDVLAVVPPHGTFVALEAKMMSRLLMDPFDPGRREGPLLHHPFQGPQIAMLEKLHVVGAYARGVVRISKSYAVIFTAEQLRGLKEMGNPTHAEMMAVTGCKKENGIWKTWPAEWDVRG